MNKKTSLMYGALLHDIGKIIYRSNNHPFAKGTHSKLGRLFLSKFSGFKNNDILDCVSYHHFKELSKVKLDKDNPAYITYIADNIASGIDRRDVIEEGDQENEKHAFNFDKNTPLFSVFNIVNSQTQGQTEGKFIFSKESHIEYPKNEEVQYTSGNYTQLMEDMKQDLIEKIKVNEHHFSSLLQWTESLWQYVPSSTNKNQLVDISLYDHSRITCAIASCIYDYLTEKNICDFQNELFSNYKKTQAFYDENAFLLLSMDMSGIQDFIYNISGSKALKSLRSRSFYLEIMIEVIVDEFLYRVGLSRANLLYTGGGHAYLIVPNTNYVKEQVELFQYDIKEWFIQEFTTDLSLSIAYEACSGNDLMNSNGNYKTIWRNVSNKLSDMKSQKYTAKDILRFNHEHSHGDRECKECLRSDTEINEEGLCSVCEGIISISNDLRDKSFFVVSNSGKLKMPFNNFLNVLNYEEAETLANHDDNAKIYSKNEPFVGQGISTNLWMCDYDYASQYEEMKYSGISSYAERSVGIRRLGVVRADIDNLGTIFISGIPENYNSLSRTATLSRQLSLFFKYELTNLLKGYQITAIYSGGDDLFLIGAWDDIVEASIHINDRFNAFTMGKLTISAGIGMFNAKYPISKMAFETGLLEEAAKTGDKNQVALWMNEKVYGWKELKEQVLKEKLSLIQEAFKTTDKHEKAFIYKILVLLRNKEQINIARLAYLLSRSKMTNDFSSLVFKWAQEEQEKEELITALEYYIYQIREAE
ncbi:type III-A CRISPR-associated protein Cas10/Csm1 [Staphylococcus ursi]|uniref:type III-A CRISPR-associated protein Cas10/Csm1 n=1 Tax=Staphylococcus sp. MI 10-1553 TaxID=1912064 RepID=UPI001398AB51|nr:type III-A CRISPR-associated protein Cas10/Csm1 [Staphylococcus sp. MI 10-1553]QHW35983.1 type III-A CRISPR-associated protein Cas10/Csm1 [Staphylococcus sp. MI 10-1553]